MAVAEPTLAAGGQAGTATVSRQLPGVPLLLGAENEADLDTLTGLLEEARKDPRGALARLLALKDDSLMEEGFRAISMGWATVAPAECAVWVSSVADPDLQAEAALGLSAVWSGKDGAATIGWVRTLPEGRARDMALVETAAGWSTVTPLPALESYLALPPERALDQALDELLWRAIERQPEQTLARLDKVEGPRRDPLLEAALIANTHEKPADAWRQATLIKDPDAGLRVRQVALGRIAEANPGQALALFTEAGSPRLLVAPIVESWFPADPEATLRWIQGLPSEAHKAAAREVITPAE